MKMRNSFWRPGNRFSNCF